MKKFLIIFSLTLLIIYAANHVFFLAFSSNSRGIQAKIESGTLIIYKWGGTRYNGGWGITAYYEGFTIYRRTHHQEHAIGHVKWGNRSIVYVLKFTYAIVAMVITIAFVLCMNIWRRRDKSMCTACGYRVLSLPICPECGAAVVGAKNHIRSSPPPSGSGDGGRPPSESK